MYIKGPKFHYYIDNIFILACVIIAAISLYGFYYFFIPYKVNKDCIVTITTRKCITYTYKATVEWSRIMHGRPNIFIYNDEDYGE